MKTIAASAVVVALLGACASPAEIAKEPVAATFESALSPKKLAFCIDKNAEDLPWKGSGLSKVYDSGTEPIEVIVKSNSPGVTEIASTHAVVHIWSGKGGSGSRADFRFGSPFVIGRPGEYVKMFAAGCD